MDNAPNAPHETGTDRKQSDPPGTVGFARVAQRISSWTSRMLVTLIVIVAGLGFGRQVLQWWTPSKPMTTPSQPLPAEMLGDPTRPHTLRFGDQSWSITTQIFPGGKAEAVGALRASCRRAIVRLVAAGEPGTTPSKGEIDLIASLSQQKPAEEEAGKWRLYQTDDVFPMVVGIRPNQTAPPITGANLAQQGFSVLTWGIAVPSSPNAWMLYTMQPVRGGGAPSVGFAGLPLPPGSRNTLSLQGAGGGGMAAFEGSGELATWKRFYDQWFATNGWKATIAWQGSDAALYAKFVPAVPNPTEEVDLRIGYDRRGRLSGLLTLTPSVHEE